MPKKGTEGAKGRVTNSPSHKRYEAENRESKNKARNNNTAMAHMLRHDAKWDSAKRTRRGATRAFRRQSKANPKSTKTVLLSKFHAQLAIYCHENGFEINY